MGHRLARWFGTDFEAIDTVAMVGICFADDGNLINELG